jgi:hypothetical protein
MVLGRAKGVGVGVRATLGAQARARNVREIRTPARINFLIRHLLGGVTGIIINNSLK